jgi:hypothetical protein
MLDNLDRSCGLVMEEYIKQNCMKILEENWILNEELKIAAKDYTDLFIKYAITAILLLISLIVNLIFIII